jgi:hypothetical protein
MLSEKNDGVDVAKNTNAMADGSVKPAHAANPPR